MNNNVFFNGSLDNLELIEYEGNQVPSFEMKAYTGVPILQGNFDYPVVVDLTGMDISQRIPIRLNHNADKMVGHTTEICVKDGVLTAKGMISHDTDSSRTVAKSGKLGYPWQASIGARVLEREFVSETKTVEVNGKEFEGPLIVATKTELKEISFVDYGADPNTAAIVAKEVVLEKEKDVKERKKGCEPVKEVVAEQTAETEVVQAAAPAQSTDINAILDQQRELMAQEVERIDRINKVAQPGFEELKAKAIREQWSADRFELTMLRAARPAEAPAVQVRERVAPSKRVCEIVALRSSGHFGYNDEKNYTEQELEAADQYKRCGLREYISLCCGFGKYDNLPNARQDTKEWLHAAFDSTSLPGILSNNANKVLLQGYEAVDDCWRQCFKIGAVSDFKTHTRYRMNSDFVFEKVPRGGEIKHGQVSEEIYTQKIDTYGIMFSLTRQMIIDDDLGALFDIPFQIGLGAGQAISDAVWGLVLSNPNVADGKAFFHADHQSLLTGNALSIAGLTAAETAFRKKVGPNKRPINARPEILLVPPELLSTAELLMTAENVNETTTTNKPSPNRNPHRGKFQVLCSPYLSLTNSGSETAYYLLSNPVRIPSFEIAFLGGIDRPTVERADADFNTLGVQFRGYLDFGVKEQDYRGALKVTGV